MNGLGRQAVPHSAPALLTLLAWLLLTGCGKIFVGFVSNPQIPSSSLSGKVAAAVLGSVNDLHGNPLTITIVTLTNGGLASTPSFCGDQRALFPINNVVRADFTQETQCLSLVKVVIIS
ncbi:MAG TPA: hypothetical protein VGP65_16490 [Candidatus Angelobacter sp.]|nr:hypothetical protein [Candidatus Angelobacter sp.]